MVWTCQKLHDSKATPYKEETCFVGHSFVEASQANVIRAKLTPTFRDRGQPINKHAQHLSTTMSMFWHPGCHAIFSQVFVVSSQALAT